MSDKKEGWGEITGAVFSSLKKNWPSDFRAEQMRRVRGVRFEPGQTAPEPVVQVSLQGQNNSLEQFHVPLADAMYLLGALQEFQKLTGAEIPDNPPSQKE
uniref:hypothetical protein n=1 Tax=Brucella pseudintermedia TaxID=370111 RepID=UPI00158A8890|nr:hypothetical protein [Brucella pseudintermedia]